MVTSKKTQRTRYMQTVNANVKLRFVGSREEQLELRIVLPVRMGQILVRRLGKRVRE